MRRSGKRETTNRFSLVLLQEGELYFEDFAVSYFPFVNNPKQRVNGRLHICSHSLFFVPEESRFPITSFPFEKMINLENTLVPPQQAAQYTWEDAKPSPFLPNALEAPNFQPYSKESLMKFKCSQVIEMKKMNKNHPYQTRKLEPTYHIFGFNFVSSKEVLDKISRIINIWSSYKPYEKVNIREDLQKYYDGLRRDFTFDITWLEDFREQKLFEANGSRVVPLVDIHGRVLITNERIYFQAFNNISSKPVKKYALKDVRKVVKRRHNLRHTGLEIFLQNKSIFFAFPSKEIRDKAMTTILQQPKLSKNVEMNELQQVTLQWQQGLVSNFDYLMYLNLKADRSFNDIAQYPVFPWVISDYQSQELDLNNPATFRDLSKPVGALDPKRFQRFIQRFEDMPDPKFLYGTHYSTPGYVLFYLVRFVPEYMLKLQSGRFDEADRLFNSLIETWSSVLCNDADVKELIPEFYKSTGEFLLNNENLDLGVRSTGKKVHHVVLPSWAKDEKDFIYKNRLALESEHVSKNLHHWIDLIFGYKQRGKEAVKANNVFYYLTYEGNIDVDTIYDPMERNAKEMQIREFGQTPTQLFTTAHVQRQAKGTINQTFTLSSVTGSNIISLLELSTVSVSTSGTTSGASTPIKTPITPKNAFMPSKKEEVKQIQPDDDDDDLDNLLSRFGNNSTQDQQQQSKQSKESTLSDGEEEGEESSTSTALSNKSVFLLPSSFEKYSKTVSTALHRDFIGCMVIEADDKIYSVSHDATAKIFSLKSKRQVRRISDMGDMALSSCVLLSNSSDETKNLIVSSWDNKIYMYSIEYGKMLDVLHCHDDAVSQLAIHAQHMASASWDCTVKLWKCTNYGISKTPILTFSDHESEVQCIALDQKQGNLLLSGSNDGYTILYDIRQGVKPISETRSHSDSVKDVQFIDSGTFVSCDKAGTIRVGKVDGQLVSNYKVGGTVEALECLVANQDYIMTGGSLGTLKLMDVYNGTLFDSFVVNDASALTSITVSLSGNDTPLICCGLQNGEISVLQPNKKA